MSEQDTSEAHGSSIQSANSNHIQETPKSSNTSRFSLLLISIIIALLVAPFFLTDNIFNICVFFATFTTLIFALTDLIIYLSKEPPHPTIIHINSTEKGNKKTNKNSLSIVVKKVVHYTQQCRVAVSRVMGSIFRHKWLTKTFAIALSFPVALTFTEHWKEIAGKITAVLEFFIINNKSLGISILITFIFALIIFHKKIITTFQKFISGLTSKYFIFTLASLAIIGALSALLIPSYTSWFREPGYTSAQQDSAKENPEKAQNTPTPTASPTGNKAAEVEQKSTSDLRLHLLYITGGIIAILGLIETNRKNSQDHIRQVHAARRDRYVEAVDKLSSKNASVRLGGVYALVGLVDEWLDDDNIDRETQLKEGQVIINNLCSYIRSPFTLTLKAEMFESDSEPDNYEGDFSKDQAAFREEQDVRRTIFVEMNKRSSTFTKKKGEVIETVSGPWSDFDFDFSRAPIFYPLNAITIEKGNFSSAKFYSNTAFSRATFTQTADFSRATFTQDANFIEATFAQDADFIEAVFTQDADFSAAKFTQDAYFSTATFTQNAYFIGATFTQDANFIEATFTQDADFSWATFTQNADFFIATFTQNANFSRATFTQNADFFIATFTQNANFSRATFTQDANFSRATFTQKVNFDNACFENYEPTFVNGTLRAQFSIHSAQEDYNFSLHSNSKAIPPGKAELAGIKRQIPFGTVLFDPMSPKNKDGNYSGLSEPAK